MNATKVGRRGQITVPKVIRRWLNLQEGDRLTFLRRGDEVILQPLTHTLLDLRGSIPVPGPQDFTAIRKQVIERHARKASKDEV